MNETTKNHNVDLIEWIECKYKNVNIREEVF